MDQSRATVFALFGALSLSLATIALAPWLVNPLDYLKSDGEAAAPVEPERSWEFPSVAAPTLESFAVIVERPLFTATRRPAPQVAPESAAPASEAPDKTLILGRYKLTGIVVTPDLRMIFIKDSGTHKTLAVERGKELDGWVVSEVEREVIILESGDRKMRIMIGENAVIEISSE